MAVRVAICGCGRLGRLVLKSLLGDNNMEIAAIVDSNEASVLANLLELEMGRKVDFTENNIIINDLKIPVLKDVNYNEHPWEELRIDTVIENRVNRPIEVIEHHILAGAKRVITPVEQLSKLDLSIVTIDEKELFVKERLKSDIIYNDNDYKNHVKLLNQKYHSNKFLPKRKKGFK